MGELVTLHQLIELQPSLTERWARSLLGHRDPDMRLPHYRTGGRLLFDPEEVETWMRRNPAGARRDRPTGGRTRRSAAGGSEVVLRSPVPTTERDEGPPVAAREPSQ